MIARVWHGTTRPGKDANTYLTFVTGTVLSALPSIPGHRGAQVFRRLADEGVEFTVITLWDSIQAIRAFAGDDVERAVVEPEAKAVLVDFDERVEHHEVPYLTPPRAPMD
jgi:heme-degrading monooxygenase HmoA